MVWGSQTTATLRFEQNKTRQGWDLSVSALPDWPKPRKNPKRIENERSKRLGLIKTAQSDPLITVEFVVWCVIYIES